MNDPDSTLQYLIREGCALRVEQAGHKATAAFRLRCVCPWQTTHAAGVWYGNKSPSRQMLVPSDKTICEFGNTQCSCATAQSSAPLRVHWSSQHLRHLVNQSP